MYLCDDAHLWCVAVEEMRVKTAKIKSVLEQLEQQPEVDVDEAVVGANVVFDQGVKQGIEGEGKGGGARRVRKMTEGWGG